MQRYSEYKDSGVKWLGEIPSHWNVILTKYIANLYTGNSLNEASKEMYSNRRDDARAYISSKDIDLITGNVNYENGLYIPREEYIFEVAPQNSFLLCIEGGSAGRKKAFLTKECCFVNKLCCFDRIINPKFHYYFIHGEYFQTMFNCSLQGLIGGVSVSTLRNFYTVVPSIEEQECIVSYLDDIISKIDIAIAQQQRMVDLLNERKQIIINNAVTKGLNPKVRMKDSCVEWIGEIPEHWEMKRLKTILSIKDERNSDPSATLLSVYTAIGVKPRKELKERGNKANTVINYKIVNKGDLIVNRLLAWMGACGLSNYDGVTSPDYDVYAFRSGYNRLYYELYFRNTHFKSDCYKYGHGIMMMRWRTYPDEFLNIMIPVPPLEEQTAIYNHINPLINNIAAYIEKCKNQITLLQERKQIIINDVVTGKVKVI